MPLAPWSPQEFLYEEAMLSLAPPRESEPLSVPSSFESSLIPLVALSRWSSSSEMTSAPDALGRLRE